MFNIGTGEGRLRPLRSPGGPRSGGVGGQGARARSVLAARSFTSTPVGVGVERFLRTNLVRCLLYDRSRLLRLGSYPRCVSQLAGSTGESAPEVPRGSSNAPAVPVTEKLPHFSHEKS